MSKNRFATAPTMVLTPRAYNGVRLHLRVSESDFAKVTRGPGYKGIVRDVESGKRFEIRGADCGGDNCWCDATAIEVE